MREPLEICGGFLLLGVLVYLGLTFLTPLGWAIALGVFVALSLLGLAGAALWRRIGDAFAAMQAFH
jgi:hypothetical protein